MARPLLEEEYDVKSKWAPDLIPRIREGLIAEVERSRTDHTQFEPPPQFILPQPGPMTDLQGATIISLLQQLVEIESRNEERLQEISADVEEILRSM